MEMIKTACINEGQTYQMIWGLVHTAHHMIPFCRRDKEKPSVKTSWKNSNYYNFDQLLEQNVTSDQLYSWSAPIDLIEDYQNYMIHKMNYFKDEQQQFVYYNCTPPRFGMLCEYSFYLNDEVSS
jgi:hypothetical protein